MSPANGPFGDDIAQAFQRAVQFHQAGRKAEAGQLLRQIVTTDPRHADALHLLGLIYLQDEQPAVAVELIGRAAAIATDNSQYHNNLGSALRAAGHLDEAIAAFRQAIALRPDYARAFVNLGQTLDLADRATDASTAYRQATTLAPRDLEAWWGLATALHRLGDLAGADAAYEQTLRLAPGQIEIVENLAKLRFAQERRGDGIALLSEVLRRRPGQAIEWAFLAAQLQAEGRLTEAVAAADKALAAGLEPTDRADVRHGRANALAALGRAEEAVSEYRAALALRPGNFAIRSNLLMTLHVIPAITGANILAEARAFAALLPVRPDPVFAQPRDPERRLRIGYVSADFREHPVGHFLERVLPHHDPAAIESILYSDTLFPDAQTDALRRSAGWRPIAGEGDDAVEAMIRADGIDILVDLAGHTGSNRLPLFARRPAPVQAAWLGYFGTTGLIAIDHVIADGVVLPAEDEAHFVETPVRLPAPYLCWSPPAFDVPVAPAPQETNGVLTFGCFNQLAKINPPTVALWAEILQRIPGSRLFLKCWALGDEGARRAVRDLFARHGIPGDRLRCEGFSSRAEGLATYNRIDIALDPLPFGGCTTTADTLWMGVPLVTLRGDRWSGRMSATILASIEREDWIAPTPSAYVETAITLASTPQDRPGLRAALEASRFCDGPAFTAGLDAVYRAMWRDWCGKSPISAT